MKFYSLKLLVFALAFVAFCIGVAAFLDNKQSVGKNRSEHRENGHSSVSMQPDFERHLFISL